MRRLIFLPLLFMFVLLSNGQSKQVKVNNDFFLLGTLDDYMGRVTYKHIANRVDAYYPNDELLVIYICSIFKEQYPDVMYKSNDNSNRFLLQSTALAQKMNDFYDFKSTGLGAYIGKADIKTLRLDTILKNKSLFNTYFDSTYNGTLKKYIFKNDVERLSFMAGAYQRFGGVKDSVYSITMYNSSRKANVIAEQLRELKCTNVSYVVNTELYIPCRDAVYFTPTDELKRYFEVINQKVALANVSDTKSNKFENQSTLSTVALNDSDVDVRKLAVSKLTIQSTLSTVALNDSDSEVRKLAVSKLTIQSTLSTVALNDSDVEVRKLAVSKLTIQSTLSTVALNDKDSEVRKLALKLLK